MEGDDVDQPGKPGPGFKTDQQIFDEQVARASGKGVVMIGGLGIFAALVMSTIALVNSSGDSSKMVTVTAASAAATATAQAPPALTGDALGRQLFLSGKPDTGAIGCGSCHTMKAAGAVGTIGPNLDKELTADPASATRESVVDPNKEIVSGYSANVMPTNYGTALSKTELDALVNYVYHSTNIKAKAKLKGTTP
jgi:mono/diheme cytochrome c family protein